MSIKRKIIQFIIRKFLKPKDLLQELNPSLPVGNFNPFVNKNDSQYNIRDKSGKVIGSVIVERPKEGGLLTYFPNEDYPMEGFPEKETVKILAAAKSVIPLMAAHFHKEIEHYIPKDPKLYGTLAREIYRWFNETLIKRDREQNELWKQMRDIICMIVENDVAYRWRLQDALPELRVDKVGLSEADKYWCIRTPQSYRFKFEDEKDYPKIKDDIIGE